MLRQLLALMTAAALLGIADRLTAIAWAAVAALAVMATVTNPKAILSAIACLGLLTLAIRSPAAMALSLGAIGTASVVAGHVLRSRASAAGEVPLTPTRHRLPALDA